MGIFIPFNPNPNLNGVASTGTGVPIFAGETFNTAYINSITGTGGVSVSASDGVIIVGTAPGSGEANTAANVGTGEGVFQQKSGVDLRFRSILGTGSITVISGTNEIIISGSAVGGGSGETNTASNIGAGQGLWAQKSGVDLQFRSLVGSGSVSVLSGANTVAISSSAILSGTSLGTGSAIFSGVLSTDLRFRSIAGLGATSVSINPDNVIVISSSAGGGGSGEVNTASNIGAGQGLWAQKNLVDLQFRSLVASGSVSVLSGTNTIAVSSSAILSGTTTGSGEPVFISVQQTNLQFRSLVGSGGTSVVSGTFGTINISSTANPVTAITASNIGSGESVFQSITSPNQLNFRTITASGSISVVSSSTTINLSSSALLSGTSLGTGSAIMSGVLSNSLQFRSIAGIGGTSVSINPDNVIIVSSTVGGGSGEVNTASNIGAGQGVWAQKSGADLQFRSLVASGSVSVLSGTNTIAISSSAILSGTTTGTGEPVFIAVQQTNLQFRSLSGQGGIAVTSGSFGTISISSTANAITAITGTNLAAGEGVFQSITSPNQLNFRNLTASGSVSLVSGTNTINISSSAVLSGTSLGTGSAIFSGVLSTSLQFRSIAGIGSTTVSISPDNVIVVSSSAGAGAGETNTASNIGSGQGLWAQKNLVDLQFRSLVASGSVSVLSGTNTVAISSSALLSASSLGTGSAIFSGVLSTNLQFRSIAGIGSTSISVNPDNVIVVSSSGGGGEVNTASNIGAGQGVWAQKNGTDLQFRSLIASGSVSVLSGTNTIAVSSSAILSASTTGTGEPVFIAVQQTNLQFRSLVGSGGTTITSGSFGTINISSTSSPITAITATNIGSGQGLYQSISGPARLDFRSITASGSVSVVSASTTLNISSSALLSGTSLGTGSAIFSGILSTDLRFRSIAGIGSTTVSVNNDNVIIVSSSAGAGSGEVNTASNIGAGQGLWAQKNLVDLQFRSLVASGSVSVLSGTNTIAISSSAILSGTTTGTGEPVFIGLEQTNLRFRSLVGLGGITVASGALGTISFSASIGNFVGPSGSTDNAIVRFDGVSGRVGQNSDIVINDDGGIGKVPAAGTNQTGSHLVLSGGQGTGNGIPGFLIVETPSQTGSGATVQPFTRRLAIFGSTGSTTFLVGNPTSFHNTASAPIGTSSFQGTTCTGNAHGTTLSFIAGSNLGTGNAGDIVFQAGSAVQNGNGRGGSIRLLGGDSSNGAGGRLIFGTNVGGSAVERLQIDGAGAWLLGQIGNAGTTGEVLTSNGSGSEPTWGTPPGGSGEANTASNIGAGQGLWAQKSGVDLQFRSLIASGSISVLSGTNTIAISSSAILSASSTGTGEPVFVAVEQTNLRFRSLVGTGATTVSSGSFGTIVINTPAGSGSPVGDANTFQYNASGSFSGSNVLRFATGGVQLSGVIRAVAISTPSTASISGTNDILIYNPDNFAMPPGYLSCVSNGFRSARNFSISPIGSSWGEWQQMAYLAHTGNFVGFSMNSTGTSLFIPPSGTAYDLSVPRQRWACTQNNTGAVAGVFGRYALVKRGTTRLDGGGFFFYSKFKIPTNVSGNRAFIGFQSGGAAAFAIDPLGLINCFGVGYSSRDNLTGNFFIYSADATTRFSEQIPNMTRTNNNIYEVFLYCSGAAGSMNWHVNNTTSASFCASGTITTNLPAADTYLRHHLGVSNGSGSTTSNHFELMNLWWESGF